MCYVWLNVWTFPFGFLSFFFFSILFSHQPSYNTHHTLHKSGHELFNFCWYTPSPFIYISIMYGKEFEWNMRFIPITWWYYTENLTVKRRWRTKEKKNQEKIWNSVNHNNRFISIYFGFFSSHIRNLFPRVLWKLKKKDFFKWKF